MSHGVGIETSSARVRARPASERAVLEHEIREVLRSIAALQVPGEPAPALPTHALEIEAIARLRRQQARLVFRLEELRTGVPCDESFLV